MALTNVSVSPLHVGFNAYGAALIPTCDFCACDADFVVTGIGELSGLHVSQHVCKSHHPDNFVKASTGEVRRAVAYAMGRYGD